jgi:hypothetical protein
VLAGITARSSAWLPLPSTEPRVLVRYAGPAAIAVVGFSVTVALAVVGLAVVVATRWRRLVDVVRSPRAVRVGQVVAGALVLVSLPYALMSLADIAGR